MKTKLFALLCVAFASALVAVPSFAATAPRASAKERLVLMPLHVAEQDKNLQGAMETALVEGLENKYEVFAGERVQQKAREIFNKESKSARHECDETRCMQGIAEAFQAELIATANVARQDGGYFLALSIQNIFDNKVEYSRTLTCEGCSSFKAVEKLKELSGAPLQVTPPATATPSVTGQAKPAQGGAGAGISQNGQKVALIIGNAEYRAAPLRNTVNDARAMAAKLRELGFEVTEYENLKMKQAGRVLGEFRSQLRPGATALFYYAGHGLHLRGRSYLVHTDAEIESEDDVPPQGLELGAVIELMRDAGTRLNMVFLDASLNNPFAANPSGHAAEIDLPPNTVIASAARPGAVARDGKGNHGLYTEHLLSALDVPDLPLDELLQRVAKGVGQGSNGEQVPWLAGSMEGNFYFRHAE